MVYNGTQWVAVSPTPGVQRDFLTYTDPFSANTLPIHIKTNIRPSSGVEVMYRFTVEGYNWNSNAIISNDAAGHAISGNISHGVTNNYGAGASITQYVSSDGFVVLRLQPPTSFTAVGITVSGFFVNPIGFNFNVSATVVRSSSNL